MEPRIQYAKTSDGVNIAFWKLGEGPTLVIPPILFASHVQADWAVDARRATYERLAQGATVIRYDCRGIGMSDREPIDFSTEAAIRDLESVADRLGLERFAILSQPTMGPVAFAYAARQPQRVSAIAHRIQTPMGLQRGEALRRSRLIDSLAEEDWEMFTEIIARLLAGWSNPRSGRLAELMRATHTPATFRAIQQTVFGTRDEAEPVVEIPILILHALGDEAEATIARDMAASLEYSHVIGIPQTDHGPYPGESGLAAILDFIAAPQVQHVDAHAEVGLRTVLFTDLVGHTEMMTRLGDEKGRDVLREHERITREVLKQNGGTEIKTMGDGFMASFGSVTKAVECAVGVQRAFAGDGKGKMGSGEQILIRIGLNAGEPIEEEGDLFGSTVILAARIAAAAGAGEILVSDVIRQLVAGKGFLFNDRGDHALKGFEDPVRVFEVRWRDSGSQA